MKRGVKFHTHRETRKGDWAVGAYLQREQYPAWRRVTYYLTILAGPRDFAVEVTL